MSSRRRRAAERSGPRAGRPSRARRPGRAGRPAGPGRGGVACWAGARADDNDGGAGQRQQHADGRGGRDARRQRACQHRPGDIGQVEHGGIQRERGVPEHAGRMSRPQAAHPRAQRRDDEPGRGGCHHEQPGRAAGQRPGQQAKQRRGIQAAADGADPREPVPVRQPAAERTGHALAERVARHDKPGRGHRGVHGGDQEQRDADHPLRQPRADVCHREPAQHRVAKQPPV